MSPQRKAAATRARNRRARLEQVSAVMAQLSDEHRLASHHGNHRIAAILLQRIAAAGRERHRLRWSS